ncbi:MAG: GspH/FimT family pseudopilin [Thermodesulfobacteriota bacterium]
MANQLQNFSIPLRRESGFTLLELLLVLFIVGLSTALVVPSITGGITNLKIRASTKRLATTLRYARNLAISRKRPYYVRVLANENRLIVTSGRGEKKEGLEKELTLSEEIVIMVDTGDVLAFYPKGNSTGGTFDIQNTEGIPFYTVNIEPSTGRVKVEDI